MCWAGDRQGNHLQVAPQSHGEPERADADRRLLEVEAVAALAGFLNVVPEGGLAGDRERGFRLEIETRNCPLSARSEVVHYFAGADGECNPIRMEQGKRRQIQCHVDGLAPEPDRRSTVLPRLTNATVARMADVTGLSAGYCSMIRRGLRTPHPRHWDALADID